MAPEDLVRWTVALIMAAGLFVGIVGGLLTQVSGAWKDGDRLIVLRQFAWIVHGKCARVGGYEIYRGTAFFGRVSLKRTAFGLGYLKSMGFEPEFVSLLGGEPLARLDFRLRDGTLKGSFEGRKFTFARDPLAIQGMTRLPKEERRWTRAR